MLTIHHFNCGTFHPKPFDPAICHCLLLEQGDNLILIDTGIGLLDVRDPAGRIGQPTSDIVGFQFNETETAVRRIERLGRCPSDVKHIVLTHADLDHAGGLADFPHAAVHISREEHDNLHGPDPRFASANFAHMPRWRTYSVDPCVSWFGLPARPLSLGLDADALLIPLPGHTLGHCGVAVRQPAGRWLLHAGDAFYLEIEFSDPTHPIHQLTQLRAQDDPQRLESLAQLKRLKRDHADEIDIICYHDPAHLPSAACP